MAWEAITGTPTTTLTGIPSTMIIMGTIHPTTDPITTVAMGIHLPIMDMVMDITVMPIKEVRIMDTAWLHPPTVGAKWVQEQI